MNPLDKDRVFNQHRDLLLAVTYRILGQVADAEDGPSPQNRSPI